MRIFHELVVDDYVTGGGAANSLTSFQWSAVMGNIDVFRVFVVADRVSGTSPTLTVVFAELPSFQVQFNVDFAVLLNAVPLVAGQANVFSASVASSDPGMPASYALPLVYGLGGTSPAAHVKIWVTGRGRA